MDNGEEIVVGDVVWLKSGGPRMTVGHIELGGATCTWFDDMQQRNANFFLVQLTKKNPNPKPGTASVRYA